jgi:2-methylisocitrate lyase-like PEP mutase family enzyme
VSDQAQKARRFLELHHGEAPLLLANAWDHGSAKLLASLGFEALATTSSGFAATLGRLDGSVTREQTLENATEIVGASDLPVSADLENGFAEDSAGVAETVGLAIDAGLAGGSIEDFSGDRHAPIYELAAAVERIEAAAEVAHSGTVPFVLTARAENYLHGRADLADTIVRLQAYERAGADVLYAPGPTDLEEIREIIASVELPVNVLVRPGAPSVGELASLGVSRISVGGALAFAALGTVVAAAEELRERGTYGFWERSSVGVAAVRGAFD